MSFKSFFVVSEDADNKPEVVKPITESKPSTSTSVFGFGSTPKVTPSNDSTSEHLPKTIEMYEKGFNSLNQPGYDFYEFYKAVVANGVDNPAIYNMAFTMGVGMDSTVTKETLLSQSDFYVTEINKVHSDFINQGTNKRVDIVNQKNTENEALVSDLNLMREQMEQLQIQINDREKKLSVIDSKYGPMITDIDGKLSANDIAKDKLISSIEAVKSGIKTNIK